MPVTASDIAFFPGARITDAPDGGGQPRYWPLPDGVTNNLFDGITDADRAAGALSCRKVFAGLLNSDADGFTNAYVYLQDQVANGGWTNSVLFLHGGRRMLRNQNPPGAIEALVNAYQYIDKPGEPDFQTIIGTDGKGTITLVNGAVPIEVGDVIKFFGSPQRFPGNVLGASPIHGTAWVDSIVSTGTYYGLATTKITYTIIWESPGGFIRGDSLCSRVEPAVVDAALGALQPALPVGFAPMVGGVSAGATEILVAYVSQRLVPEYVDGQTPLGVAANGLLEWNGNVPIFRRGGKIVLRDGGTSEVAEVLRVGWDGYLTLTAPLANSYGTSTTVHGLCPVGDVAASVDTFISQRTWGRVFADEPVGPTEPDLHDGTTITVSNAGSIEQRWVCVFGLDTTQFELYGESLGFVVAGDTSTDLAPLNPVTGEPYFTLPAAGWNTIAIGNAFRFNTYGSLAPEALWITRCASADPLDVGTYDGGVTLALRDGASGATGTVDIPWDTSTQLGGQGTPPTAPPAPTGDLPTPTLSPGGSIPALAAYRQVHTLAVTLEATSAALPVESVTLSIEDGSVCWTLSATGRPSLYAQFAEATTPQQVRVAIDGIEWLFIVEAATRNRSGTDQHAVTITGRSAAMAAGEPYAQPRNWINDGAITAAQMAVFSQEGTATQVQWYVLDWLIPDKVLTFAGSPLALVQRIAETIGAQVECDRVSNAIYVIPRYPRMPTDWASATPDVTIAEEAIRADSYQRADRPAYNSVFVSGQQQGVLGQVFLAGTDGAAQAPIVTDLLVTDAPAVLQRGRTILGGSGPQARISMTLPVLTGSGRPGVLSRGQLIEVGGAWRGMVRSVSVNAALPLVEQTVVIERHFPYPP
jgi:hypothetical protein